MIKENAFIDSSKMVAKQVEELHGSDEIFKNTELLARKVMKDMRMRYRKVTHIAMSANSQRSLVLR